MESKSPEKVEMKWLYILVNEVEKALKKYLEVRENIIPISGHEHSLFYSTQEKESVFRLLKTLSKIMQKLLQLQKNYAS